MKRCPVIYLLVFFTVLHGSANYSEPFRRGLFVTVIQKPQVLSSRDEIVKLVNFAGSARIDTLFVQVYYGGRAWFPSKTADSKPYEDCLERVSEDPLALLIKEAHAAGIEVHAWLNLLSLGSNKDAVILKKYGTDILTRNRKEKGSLEDYKIDGQYFLEPGDENVHRELSGIVAEVVKGYPELDGVQFDYIRYPDKDPDYGYTKANMGRFKKANASEEAKNCSRAWRDWKRAQVTELLRLLTVEARSARKGIQVSATGCMPYSRAYYEAFQDWPSWLEYGIVDFVTIMSYSPYPPEFLRWLEKAKKVTKDFKKVYVGLGAYKLVRSRGIFENEFRICEESTAGGCVIFHYGSLLEDPDLGDVLKDCQKSALQKEADARAP